MTQPNGMTRLPDGSAFFVAEVDTQAKPPANPIHWNPYNKVVHDHRTGEIIQPDTDNERSKRGLPVPWKTDYADSEVELAPIF